MTDIYALKHKHLTKDMNFIKKLEQKQKQFERLSCHRTSQNSRFKAHPNLLHSDSDTTASASCTPRVTTTFSASTTTLVYPKPSGSFRETKLRAANYHRLLHEKLSIIDGNPSHLSDFTGTGDCMPHRSGRSSTSLGSCSLDSVYGDFTDFRCHSLAPKKPLEKSSNKPNSAAEKKSNASRLSSQQSFAPKGIPISVFERKVKVVVTKSLQNITEIKSIMAQGIEPPDGEEEEAKRVVRAKEFSNRFSRNYLYPLGRQLQDFNSPTLTQLNPLIINQKLLSAYQIIQTALQAYQHYLPSSHGDCTFTQLKILMNHILGICDIHRMQLKDQEDSYLVEFVDSYKINAELVIQKVDEMLTLPKSDKKLEASKSEQSKCVAGKQLTKRLKGSKSKLSMYTTTASFRKDAAWKRAVDCLAKKRFNVKSKYRTAAFKHRPPMQKETDNNLAISRLKNLFPEKSGASRATRLNSPVNEDTIKTMVEAQMNGDTLMIQKEEWEKMEKKNGGKSGAEVHSNKEDLLIKLLQFTLKSHQDDDEPPKGEKITEIVNLIKNESNEDFLKKIIDGLSTPAAKPAEGQELTLQIVKSQVNISEESREGSKKSARREPKVTVTGDRNARLICITDDNSLIEPVEEIPDEGDKVAKTSSSQTQIDVGDDKKTNKATPPRNQKTKPKNFSNMKISRIKKCERSLKPLDSLDKKLAVEAIQYKLDFYRHCKNNPMYKRSTTCQPWVLMNKLSEDILNECLLGVAREIEVNDMVERVYQSELQL